MQSNSRVTREYSSRYETEALLNEYLLFHYGNDADQLPFECGPKEAIQFPLRCVRECLDISILPPTAKALDLGCAVGRSSFELATYCPQVVGIDNSKAFIAAAQQIQISGRIDFCVLEEGGVSARRLAKRPDNIDPNRIQFVCCDAMDVFQQTVLYDVVLAANLMCRLPDPKLFLNQLPAIVSPGGQLILTSPYSWLEEFTPKEYWLGHSGFAHKKALDEIKEILYSKFHLLRTLEMPFLMREHCRKYQWGVSQASIWKRL